MNEKETVEGPLVEDGVAGRTTSAGGVNGDSAAGSGPHVHMDAMAFGMGCCCLQVTFQVRTVTVGTVARTVARAVSSLMRAPMLPTII